MFHMYNKVADGQLSQVLKKRVGGSRWLLPLTTSRAPLSEDVAFRDEHHPGSREREAVGEITYDDLRATRRRFVEQAVLKLRGPTR